MSNDFRAAIAERRSNYDLSGKSSLSDAELQELVEYASLNTPSAFNMQSGRIVLLLGENHKKLWEIVRETLRKMVPPDNFKATDDKISSFSAGYGTVLFYEDKTTVKRFQTNFPLYAEMLPWFSSNGAGMLQFTVWTMLRDAGMGASLQHYGNLIEDQVAKEWGLDSNWMLIAQMPFGVPNSFPKQPEQLPVSDRVKVIK